MTLDALKTVIIDENSPYKFIVAEVSDGQGNKKVVVRALGGNDLFHVQIVRALQREAPDLLVACLGGGYIEVNAKRKEVRIWDESSRYGQEPDRQQTAALLQEAYPEYTVTIG